LTPGDRHYQFYTMESKMTVCNTRNNVCQTDLIVFIGNIITCLTSHQSSPNEARHATFLTWFQLNCPVPAKRRSFSHPVSLWTSVFFFINNHTFSSIVTYKELPCSWNLTFTGFDIQYFIPNLLIASFFLNHCAAHLFS